MSSACRQHVFSTDAPSSIPALLVRSCALQSARTPGLLQRPPPHPCGWTPSAAASPHHPLPPSAVSQSYLLVLMACVLRSPGPPRHRPPAHVHLALACCKPKIALCAFHPRLHLSLKSSHDADFSGRMTRLCLSLLPCRSAARAAVARCFGPAAQAVGVWRSAARRRSPCPASPAKRELPTVLHLTTERRMEIGTSSDRACRAFRLKLSSHPLGPEALSHPLKPEQTPWPAVVCFQAGTCSATSLIPQAYNTRSPPPPPTYPSPLRGTRRITTGDTEETLTDDGRGLPMPPPPKPLRAPINLSSLSG